MSTLEEFARSRGYVIRVDRGPRGDEAPVREFVLTSADVAEIAQLQARGAELEAALREALPVIAPDDLHAKCEAF